jgi:hypothetical protein
MPAERRASLPLGRAKDDAEIRTGAGRHADTDAASDRPAVARRVRATLFTAPVREET